MREINGYPVFVVRHGETESNLQKRYAGRDPEALTSVGRSQIAAVAVRLQDYHLREIWSSSINRARESAAILGHALEIPVRIDQRLDEMSLGPWEGLTEMQVAEGYPDEYSLWDVRPDLVRLEGREPLDAVAGRAIPTLLDASLRGGCCS